MLSATQKMLSDIFLSMLMSHAHADKTLAIIIAYNARTDQTFIRQYDVISTVHHSIDLFHLPTLMHNSFIH